MLLIYLTFSLFPFGFIKNIGVGLFNSIFGGFKEKMYYPEVNKSLKLANETLVNTLKRYNTYVAISYCQYGLEDWKCGRCEKTMETNNTQFIGRIIAPKYNHYGYVAVNHNFKEIMLNFNGASTAEHWTMMEFDFLRQTVGNITDFKSKYNIKGDIKIHKGFYKLFTDIYPESLRILEKAFIVFPSYAIVLNGHSMGGGFVGLMAMQLAIENRFQNASIILSSFGSPRVGNIHFAKLIPKITTRAYRITHSSDLIPKLAPRYFGYAHYGVEIWVVDSSIGTPTRPVAFKDPVGSDFKNIQTKTYICDDYRDKFGGYEDRRCIASTVLRVSAKFIKNDSDALQPNPIIEDDFTSLAKGLSSTQSKYKFNSDSLPNYYMHSIYWNQYSTSVPEFSHCITKKQFLNKTL